MQKSFGSNSQDVKQKNRALVLKLVAVNQGISRVDLARITGLSKMTVGNLVTELMEEGWITELISADSQNRNLHNNNSSGRKPIMLALSSASPCICGMLIKRELCQIILGDFAGNVLDQIRYDYMKLENGEELIEILYQGFCKLSSRTNRKILAIGIASLGPVDSLSGVIRNPPYFYGIENVPIVSILQERTHCPAFLVNDANAGALAEKVYGLGKDISNFTYLHIMNGIGAGLVLKEELYNGDTGQSGEIGHTSINFAGPQCACGNRGCLDLYANVDNMRQKILELKNIYPRSPLAHKDRPSWRNIIDSAGRKDSLAIMVLDEFCSYISYALINMLNLLNISTLIIGYDSSGEEYVIEEMLRTKLSHSLQSVNFDNITVMHSSFNGDAPLIGSIAYVADKIFSLQENL